MEKKLKKSNITGFIWILGLGILLHFTFRWSGQNPAVGLFSAVNESTWEHMKILYMPAFVYFLIEYKKHRRFRENLLLARTLGLLCGVAFVPIAFYTYSGVIGKSFLCADILVFAAAVCLTLYISSRFCQRHFRFTSLAAFLILIPLLALFFLCTFYTPHIALFLDPVHFTYGI